MTVTHAELQERVRVLEHGLQMARKDLDIFKSKLEGRDRELDAVKQLNAYLIQQCVLVMITCVDGNNKIRTRLEGATQPA